MYTPWIWRGPCVMGLFTGVYTAGTRQVHGRYMAGTWQAHGRHMPWTLSDRKNKRMKVIAFYMHLTISNLYICLNIPNIFEFLIQSKVLKVIESDKMNGRCEKVCPLQVRKH